MNISWNLFIAIGIFTKLLFGYQAPGTLILKITYRIDPKAESPGPAELHSTIRTRNTILYNNKNQLRSNENNKQRLETLISFEISNISALLSYKGRLQIPLNNIGNSRTIEFLESPFQFRIKKSDTKKFITASFYDEKIEQELGVVLTAKCRRNFYPQYQCSVMCIESENTEYCNPEGKKICRKGYFFNSQLQTCDIDWCWNAAFGCQNKGSCINKKKEFVCACSPLYTGKYCEQYVNLCENFICDNGTTCTIKNLKIECVKNTLQKSTDNLNFSSSKNISIHTLLAIMIFLIIMIFTTATTIWACQTPTKKKSRSIETSINSGHSYYPCNSLHKISESCLFCNQNLHRCSCIRNTFLGDRHYHSLKSPGNRFIGSWNRAQSDIVISNFDKQLSASTLNDHDETLPLPPLIEYDTTEDSVML